MKPSNILVAPGNKPKLTDFGLAAVAEERLLSITSAGQLVGTPLFMAPEQVSKGAADVRTDVWGLAASIYFALTGRPPHVAPDPRALFDKIEHEPVDLEPLAQTIGARGARVFSRMFHTDPERRLHAAAAAYELTSLAVELGAA